MSEELLVALEGAGAFILVVLFLWFHNNQGKSRRQLAQEDKLRKAQLADEEMSEADEEAAAEDRFRKP
jgi:hypothetical protein